MRTVKSLIEELQKFPEDAKCYAYEGEFSGIVIQSENNKQGVIYCYESNRYPDPDTETFPDEFTIISSILTND